MCDCLEPRPPFRPNRKHPRHEARQPYAGWRNIEIACCGFDGHDRCKRAELLAKLNFAVEPIAHFGGMRRRENTAMAECAWPELKSALHPSRSEERRVG